MLTWNHAQLALHVLAAAIVIAWIVAFVRNERPQPAPVKREEDR
ncbi:hypothetical protein ACWDA7_13960 [Streptomyces sp. NPDC001156]